MTMLRPRQPAQVREIFGWSGFKPRLPPAASGRMSRHVRRKPLASATTGLRPSP